MTHLSTILAHQGSPYSKKEDLHQGQSLTAVDTTAQSLHQTFGISFSAALALAEKYGEKISENGKSQFDLRVETLVRNGMDYSLAYERVQQDRQFFYDQALDIKKDDNASSLIGFSLPWMRIGGSIGKEPWPSFGCNKKSWTVCGTTYPD